MSKSQNITVLYDQHKLSLIGVELLEPNGAYRITELLGYDGYTVDNIVEVLSCELRSNQLVVSIRYVKGDGTSDADSVYITRNEHGELQTEF